MCGELDIIYGEEERQEIELVREREGDGGKIMEFYFVCFDIILEELGSTDMIIFFLDQDKKDLVDKLFKDKMVIYFINF